MSDYFESGDAVAYNPWPLGHLPPQWQRPELELVRQHGVHWTDAREIVAEFESRIAAYCGSAFAVSTDSASNALALCLKYVDAQGEVSVPRRTYVSVLAQIVHAGCTVRLRDEAWSGLYSLDPYPILDSAARFRRNIYVKGSLQVLSFQIKKRLPIGRGGAILTDSIDAYRWLKLASYDGRDLQSPYDSEAHVAFPGWHFYMTPEDAARGILLLSQLQGDEIDTASWRNYPPLDSYPALSEWIA